jgi:tRNA(adenine34) deaminase
MTRTGVFAEDEHFMRLALREAIAAGEHGDVPVGAVVVRDGEVIGRGQNERELRADPTAHAEMLALRAAALTLGGWRLTGAVLYVTLEPCPMCAGAIQQARISRTVYGAPDHKVGAAGTVLNILGDPRLLHRVQVQGGVLAAESLGILQRFFDERR